MSIALQPSKARVVADAQKLNSNRGVELIYIYFN